MVQIIPVPCRADNYMYLIVPEGSKNAIAVDPYDLVKLKEAATKSNLIIGSNLFLTHHHADHSGGNADFIKEFPEVKIYAGSNKTPGVTNLLKHKDTFTVDGLAVTAVATPCHTQDHICFYVEDPAKDQRSVFTGDTLFVSGTGRFFEGTPTEMNEALNVRLAALPNDTVTYVGHEYTAQNVAFSSSVEPENPDIKKLQAFCGENEVTTGKFTIGDEKKHNVFMRLNESAVIKAVTKKMVLKDPTQVEVMGGLREMKNNF